MEFMAELKNRGRITIPIVVVQFLALKAGDFIKVNVEVVKRAEMLQRAFDRGVEIGVKQGEALNLEKTLKEAK